MLPPFTEAGIPVPDASETTTCVTWIAVDVLVVPGARVKVNCATVPLEIALWLNPKITHCVEPVALVHVKDLPAEFATAPIDPETPVISPGEYCNVHCSAAGCVPPVASARLRVTLLPGVPEPDPSDKLAVWAFASAATANMPRITVRNLNLQVRNACSGLGQNFRHSCITCISPCK
jgi:hypothetical protein